MSSSTEIRVQTLISLSTPTSIFQGSYEKIRCLSYPHANVFIVCFSLIDKKTLDSCRTLWLPEIRKYAGDNVPVMLVGTKQDLLETADSRNVVSEDYARKVASEVS